MDTVKHRVKRGGKDIDLTNREYASLSSFCVTPTKSSPDMLSEHVWEVILILSRTSLTSILPPPPEDRRKRHAETAPYFARQGYMLQIRKKNDPVVRFSLTICILGSGDHSLCFWCITLRQRKNKFVHTIDALLVAQVEGTETHFIRSGSRIRKPAEGARSSAIFLMRSHRALPLLSPVGRRDRRVGHFPPIRILSREGVSLAMSLF